MIFTITLEWRGKEYTYQQEITSSAQQKAENWSDEVLAEYLYEEGNYDCDCNRSRFLSRYCGVSFKPDDVVEDDDENVEWVLECGQEIKLISLSPRPTYPEKTIYIQQLNGLYLPTRI